ncbi:MAG: DNA repair protein RadA [Chloroflexi bacterium]|jgi:DNA repair protein RadA/Sms|nr:DNA repair protein RadA [Chloroflexota bacterium]MBT7082325.1 DNA repair protein RadA [Chloroflexota bacterium]MBT7290604.1 DNA repair protein RadA [Chloroflexota bacterium]
MAKPKGKTVFVCNDCGNESPKWMGHCSVCDQWNTYVEMSIAPKSSSGERQNASLLSDISSNDAPRIKLPINELNQVLGGGIVQGSLVLIGGDPGIGKSTLLLKTAAAICDNDGTALYVSGEESAHQIKMRADRLGIDGNGLYLLAETDMDNILNQIDHISPQLVVIDSIQSVHAPELPSAAGSTAQVRDCTVKLMGWAKSKGTPVLIVGHVTKDGAIAGPHTLEHIVDVVLYLEGERFSSYRLLRSVKNRFGSTNEVGVFEMTDKGLTEVSNPSKAFLSEHSGTVGSTIVPTIEGTRPLLVEIQALTNQTNFGMPRRTTNGVDFNRLVLISAVLSKRAGISLYNQDIIVNVVGGLKVNEPGADLGIALSIASSFRDKPVKPDLIAIGEVGLNGELRNVSQVERRIAEAKKLGFAQCLLPAQSQAQNIRGINIIKAKSLKEAIELGLTSP